MKINGKHYRSVWPIGEDAFGIIDQTKLPHEFVTLTLRNSAGRCACGYQNHADARRASDRCGGRLWPGAGDARRCRPTKISPSVHDMLAETRPTAINLRWALGRMRDALLNRPRDERAALAWTEAAAIADEDVAMIQGHRRARPGDDQTR